MIFSVSFYLSLLLFLLVLKLSYDYGQFVKQYKSYYKIPGPPSLPIIGNILCFIKTPEKLFIEERQRCLKYYPIYKISTFNYQAVIIFSPEDIEIVISGLKNITKSFIYHFFLPWLNRGLLTSTGLQWHNRRKILTPAFHFSILKDFINVFNEESKKLVENIDKECVKNNSINVIPFISNFTLSSIAKTAMGTQLTIKNNNYIEAIHKIGLLIVHRILRPWLHNDFIFTFTPSGRLFKKLVYILHTFTREIIKKRKTKLNMPSNLKSKKLVMLDLMLKAKEEGANIDDEGISEEVDTFMFEGHDTVSSGISFALFAIANHPKIQEEIFQEIMTIIDLNRDPNYTDLKNLKYMERVIKESLRLYPSVPFISRIAEEDITTVTGYLIPKGTNVHIAIYDLHHNPNVFPNPENFDPDRFLPENSKNRHPFAFLPFSAGPRNCIGQKFAILEIKSALVHILRKFILVPTDTNLIFTTDIILRVKNSIKIKFLKR